MSEKNPYDEHTARYDSWYDNHPAEYASELEAVCAFVPATSFGVEIGVGTARFAARLGVKVGIDPSLSMLSYAVKRDVRCIAAIAEALPFKDGSFDYALMVTALCVVNDAAKSIVEAHRVIKRGGCFVAGFLDISSRSGSEYAKRYETSPFSQGVHFRSALEVEELCKKAGFNNLSFVQTLFSPLENLTEPENHKSGYGEGLFVVVNALKR